MRLAVITICALLLSMNTLLAQEAEVKLSLADSIFQLTDNQWNLDSMKVAYWADSLKSKVHFKFDRDSVRLASRIDSLKAIGTVPGQYLDRMDSLVQKKDGLIAEVDSRQKQILTKARSRVDDWKKTVDSKLKIGGMPKVSDVNLPDVETLELPAELSQLELPALPEMDLSELHNIELSQELASLNESLSFDKMGGLPSLSDELGSVTESGSELKGMVKDPAAAIEQSVLQIDELNKVTEALQGAEALNNNEIIQKVQQLDNPDALKEEIKEQVTQRAINHFAGKEQALQSAMEKMAKYKAKYESLGSLSDVKRLPKNSMRGKPIRQRLVPGVAFQFQKSAEDLFLDINPYLGYRIAGRLTSGGGWNQRVGYSKKHDHFTSATLVYGPRLFAEFRTWRGFSGRVEAEWMRSTVPSMFKSATSDPEQRMWVFTPLMGIKKEYRFFKNIKGTVHLMFNLYNPLHKSPYGDLIYSRFGFEFPMKAKAK